MHDRSNHVFRAHFRTPNRQRTCKLASYVNRLFLVVHIILLMLPRHGPFFRAGRRDDGDPYMKPPNTARQVTPERAVGSAS